MTRDSVSARAHRRLAALRSSRAASGVRRAVARIRPLTTWLRAPDGAAARARGRLDLARRALGLRRGAIAAFDAARADVTRLAPEPRSGATVSVVLVIDADSYTRSPVGPRSPVGGTTKETFADALEVIAVCHGRRAHAPGWSSTTVRSAPGESAVAAAARAAESARGDRVCFWVASNEPVGTDGLRGLAHALDATPGATAAAAQLVHPVRPRHRATPFDGRVRQFGLRLGVSRAAPVLVAIDAGTPVHAAGVAPVVPGASAACLLVDRAAYERVGGLAGATDLDRADLDPTDLDPTDLDVAGFDLGRRLRAAGGTVVAVSGTLVVDHRPVPGIDALTHPVAPTHPAWTRLVDAVGPTLMREAEPLASGRLRIAVTVAAPNRKVAGRWGDWHLAHDFARALGELGHVVRVQTADEADDIAGRACDVYCVVRGLAPIRRARGQFHVLWIISHPEQIETAELDAADLVLVASVRFAAELRTRTRTPVEPFLQATDATRFRPGTPEPAHRHDVTVVAKSRDQYRTAVADAIAAGLRPAIYGSGWDGLVDPALIVGNYVDNAELPRVYASAGVLLNDHWASMREWGFVSNRLFDALACGTPVVSDELPEIAELFAGAVPTFHDADSLRRLVDGLLADPAAAQARAARGRAIVLEHHTFAHRAQQFVEALERNGLEPA